MSLIRTAAPVLALAALSATPAAHAQCEGEWERGLGVPGVRSTNSTNVFAQTPWDPDGAGPLPPVLVVAGLFEQANGVAANFVATWDGTELAQLGAGFTGWVFSLAVWNGQLYAGGNFQNSGAVPVSKIARWNGAAWEGVGGGITASGFEGVNAMTVHNGELIAAGLFTAAGAPPVAAANIARFNGTSWASAGWAGGEIDALASYAGQLYAGGAFTIANSGFDRIARWNGAAWSAVGPGANGAVHALLPFGGTLIVAGNFTDRGQRIAQWNGTAWTGLWGSGGGGMDAQVYALHAHNGQLHAGGGFAVAGNNPIPRVARWNGSSWLAVGGAANDATVRSLATFDGDLYAGTAGGRLGGRLLGSIGRWDGALWRPLGLGFDNTIAAWCRHQDQLYAAGAFTSAAGDPVARIARRTATGWAPVGGGIPGGLVYALASYDGRLVAAGSFSQAGSVAVNNIAAWDGAAWQPLGLGLNNLVYALAVVGGDLIAAGEFTAVGGGGVGASRIARWDGATWQPMGSGFNARAQSLLVFNGQLYCGGSFATAGAATVNGIARWDGAAWQPLASGLGTQRNVTALAEYDAQLIAGGNDLNPGNCVARWNGSAWSALGPNVWGACFPGVVAFTTYNDELIAGGAFSCGSLSNNILRWDGAAWAPLGAGVGTSGGNGAPVRALTTDAGALLVGGTFRTVDDGIPSAFIARWACGGDACPADFNGDGTVNVQDFLAFLGAYAAGLPTADFTGDGNVNVQDFLAYLSAFAAGCP